MTARVSNPGKPRVCGGIFKPDPTLPADQSGRQVCVCGLLGKAGDAHHTLPSAGMDVQQLRAGEGGER